MIPKSINNGNDIDYVYLDVLNSNDVGENLTLEKPCASNNLEQSIPNLPEQNHTEGKYLSFSI